MCAVWVASLCPSLTSTSGQAGKETCRRFLSLNAVWISLQFFTLLLVGLIVLKVVVYLHKILIS